MTDYDNSREYLISNNKTTEEQQSTYNDLVKQIKEFLERQFNVFETILKIKLF